MSPPIGPTRETEQEKNVIDHGQRLKSYLVYYLVNCHMVVSGTP